LSKKEKLTDRRTQNERIKRKQTQNNHMKEKFFFPGLTFLTWEEEEKCLIIELQ
jgi:hypothetical protein